MSDDEKSSAELLAELEALRTRVNELERVEIEHRQVEESLRLAEFSVDHAPVATHWMAPDGRLLRANDAACCLLGY